MAKVDKEGNMAKVVKVARIELWIATGLGLGYSPLISGTVGSLGGVVLFWFLHRLSWPLYMITVAALFFLGLWAADRAEIIFQEKDSGFIVIDEIVGFLITAFLIPWNLGWMTAAFLLFRFFDILKPFPWRRVEKLPGGVGIMLDDAGAAIYANLLLHAVRVWLWPTVCFLRF